MSNPELRCLVQEWYKELLRCSEPDKLLPGLFQDGIFDLDDMDEVRAEKNRKKKSQNCWNEYYAQITRERCRCL